MSDSRESRPGGSVNPIRHTILLVDDEPANLATITSFLAEGGYQILVAQTGNAGLAIARRATPDLILLDVLLPDIDGFEVCRRLKSDDATRSIPVLFMTIVTSMDDKVKGFEVGAVDYIAKPFQRDEMLARVSTHLSLSRLQRDLQDLNRGLERQVAARTSELESANAHLQVELAERRRAEAYIRLLTQAIEQSPVSILITDVEGRIQFVNSEFTKATGYSPAETLGQNPRILKSGDTPPEEYRRLWQTISSGGVWQGQFHNRKKNGELFWEQATIAPVRDAGNGVSYYIAVEEDITERKLHEEHLRQTQKMEAIGQLAGGIAHDFNNILSAIVGYTDLSLAILGPDNEASDYLAQVLKACVRAKELIQQILMFSRETDQDIRPIRLSIPVKEALKLIRASIPSTIEIRSEISSEASALANHTQIHQVLMNLCANAAHAMGEKGGILEVKLTDITVDPARLGKEYPDANPGEYIRLAVSDEGSGIDPQYLHRIFDPFFTTKKPGEGTGLGLSVVHGIVKNSGGFIYVRSQRGEGTTFEILIPAQGRLAASEPDTDRPVPKGGESVLFIDDEIMIADIGKKMLESLGYRVVTKTNPGEALQIFKTWPDGFDLVVTDMIMPKMSGLDLAERIHQLRPDIPIIMTTGYDVKYDSGKLASHGLQAVINKPMSRHDLAAVVRKALDSR